MMDRPYRTHWQQSDMAMTTDIPRMRGCLNVVAQRLMQKVSLCETCLQSQVASMMWLRLRDVQIISAYYELRVDHPVLLLPSRLSRNFWLTFQHSTFPFLLLMADPKREKTNRRHCSAQQDNPVHKVAYSPFKIRSVLESV
jgi:hypothetical protein